MISEVINPEWYQDPTWMEVHRDLETYSVDKHVFYTENGHVYRKGWEWTHCLYGLQSLGCIDSSARALGVGAGREPVIFWLADRIREVIATDIYGDEKWSNSGGKEAAAEVLVDASPYCPRAVDLSKAKFQYADGLDLPFEDGEFDFCWSLSSVEHFGGQDQAARAVQEMIRVLRPGGIAVVATEYLVLPEYNHPEAFTKDQFQRSIIEASSEAELVDEMNWDLPPVEYLVDSVPIPQNVHRRRRHVILNDGNTQWTSAMVFLRKRQ